MALSRKDYLAQRSARANRYKSTPEPAKVIRSQPKPSPQPIFEKVEAVEEATEEEEEEIEAVEEEEIEAIEESTQDDG